MDGDSARGRPGPHEDGQLQAPEVERLLRRHAKLAPKLAEAYPRIPSLDAADAAMCARLIAAVPPLPTETTEQELVAAIYRAPDDDAPRMVYADWLQERGDPRGEFITLQLAVARGDATRASRTRQAALLAEHMKAWLGPLASMVKSTTVKFARGFLDACELKGTWDQRLDDDPAWSTVRALTVGNHGLILLAAIERPLSIEVLEWSLSSNSGSRPQSSLDNAVAAFVRLRLPRLQRVRIFHRWAAHLGPERRARLEAAPFAGTLASFAIEV